MALRLIKAALVLLLGFALAGQGAFSAAAAPVAKRSCCCTGCDNKHCATPSCCIKPETPSAPVSPAPLPSSSQNEFHALAAVVTLLTTLPARPVAELPCRLVPVSSVTDIPLFQWNCSYLL
jgi:hypothetical protein